MALDKDGKEIEITIGDLSGSNHQDNTDTRTQQQKDADVETQRLVDEQANKDKETADAAKALEDKAKELGGAKFDDKGNLLDDKGTIVKSKEDLDKEGANDTEITFEEDEKGNITKDGKIVIEAKDVKRDKDGNPLIPDELVNPVQKGTLIEELSKFTGINIVDEKGVPIVYDETEEGIAKYVQDAIEVGTHNAALKLFENMPDVKNYFLHRANGGQPQDFFKEATDWNKLPAAKDATPEIKIDLIVRELTAKGVDLDEAKGIAQIAKDKNKLDERYDLAVKNLKEAETAKTKAQQDEYNKRALAEQENAKQYWNQRKTIIDSNNLAGITIPDKDKGAFYDYISKPVDKDGNTQEIIDAQAEKPETNLQLSYLRFKKFNLKDVVAKEAQTQRVQTLRERVAKDKSSNGSSIKVNIVKKATNQNVTVDDILR